MGGKEIPLLPIRILDLTDEPASFCSRLLARFGADVIKIEKPGGSRSRNIGPFYESARPPENSLFFWYHNADKKGITLNLEYDRGKDIFRKLVVTADVIVESFPSGYLERLGLHYDVLKQVNPGIILASVTGFGQSGPYKNYKSCDLVSQAMGGQMSLCGSPDQPPLRLYGQQSYYINSLVAAVGIQIALFQRRITGYGQQVDISSQEAVSSTLEYMLAGYFVDEIIPVRSGNVSWNGSAAVFPCRDGFIFITFGREWSTLMELLESEHMADELTESDWQDEEYRIAHVERIVEVIMKWTMSHTVADLFELGQLMRFPWAPVSTPDEVFHSPHLRERGFFVDVEHTELKRSFPYPGEPWRFSGVEPVNTVRAPFKGEHNYAIYHDELGISGKEIEKLAEDNVI
jgi:benzylsuccinate CoA-transferase BbsE subunit